MSFSYDHDALPCELLVEKLRFQVRIDVQLRNSSFGLLEKKGHQILESLNELNIILGSIAPLQDLERGHTDDIGHFK